MNILNMYVTVETDKPQARLSFVRRLNVDKDQGLRSGILNTSTHFVYFLKRMVLHKS